MEIVPYFCRGNWDRNLVVGYLLISILYLASNIFGFSFCRSVLVLNGNGADIAKHCVPAVPAKRYPFFFG